MDVKKFLKQLSRKTKMTLVAALVVLVGGVGTFVTISDHQAQVKTAKSDLSQQIDKLTQFQTSEFLPQTYTEVIDAQVEKSVKKHDQFRKYSELAQIKSETKRIKKETAKAKAYVATNKSRQTLLESSMAIAEDYLRDKNITSENKEKLSVLLQVAQKNIAAKSFDALAEQNDALKTVNEQVKVQIDQTGAETVKKSQATLDAQKQAQDLLKSSFTSEADQQLLNSDLDRLRSAETEKSAISAVTALKATITATQKHNKPAEEKAAAEKAEADRKAAEKAAADQKAAEAAQAQENQATQAQQAPQARTVYIAPQSGRKYHFNSNCRGLRNATSISSMTESDTISNGYGLCGWED